MYKRRSVLAKYLSLVTIDQHDTVTHHPNCHHLKERKHCNKQHVWRCSHEKLLERIPNKPKNTNTCQLRMFNLLGLVPCTFFLESHPSAVCKNHVTLAKGRNLCKKNKRRVLLLRSFRRRPERREKKPSGDTKTKDTSAT